MIQSLERVKWTIDVKSKIHNKKCAPRKKKKKKAEEEERDYNFDIINDNSNLSIIIIKKFIINY